MRLMHITPFIVPHNNYLLALLIVQSIDENTKADLLKRRASQSNAAAAAAASAAAAAATAPLPELPSACKIDCSLLCSIAYIICMVVMCVI